jgi:transcription elongation factor Elf1
MKRVLICPVCKSTDLELDTGGYTGKYHCKNCGYVGFAIEMTMGEYEEMLKSGELDKFIEEKMKEIPEEKKPEKGLREG